MQGDGVGIVPSFTEKEHIDQLFTSHVKQIFKLVAY